MGRNGQQIYLTDGWLANKLNGQLCFHFDYYNKKMLYEHVFSLNSSLVSSFWSDDLKKKKQISVWPGFGPLSDISPSTGQGELGESQLNRFRWKEGIMRSLHQQRARASAQRPPPHARITISRRSRAGMEPPSPQLHTNSSAPATRRLIKAMHLFMTELIKQRKRWSPLWKHISPRGNCLWSRSPQAVSGHRFWIFVTYEETANCNAFKGKNISSEAVKWWFRTFFRGYLKLLELVP